MSILDRVSTLVRANLNDLLDRAEDPEKMIRQVLIDMHNQLIQVKTQVAAAMADEQKLYQRYLENQRQADDWQRKAELAVSRGSDDLAREALARHNTFQSTADGFKAQYEEQKKQVEQLKAGLDQLQRKIEEAEARKDLLIARARRAEAEQRVHETLGTVSRANAMTDFSRLEDRVAEKEARAKAAVELDKDSLEDKFAALETDSKVEDQLAALKAKMGQGTPPAS